ncbi:MAG TPA: TonB-dependent receptor, partial [Thermoanaerobaculia bacterium]
MIGPDILLLLLWSLRELPAADPGAAEPPAAELADEIVVTATGTEERLGETAAAVTVLTEEELATSPAVTLDETLRQVPGFTLFRRSGSRTSNPTTHGASLRGIGGSGAGRALVLADGVPLGDPFGGWVPWGLVPAAALERVEVLEGGASDLYGTAALAGVVQLLRRRPAAGGVVADVSAGEQGTAAGSAWAAHEGGAWAAAVAAQGFTSDGHVQVAPEDRGPVDVPAGGAHGSFEATVERLPADGRARPHLWLRAGLFDEERDNGTPLQENSRRIRHGAAGADRRLAGGTLAGRAWASEHDLHQTFSAVAGDRASERLVREQRVPSERLGGSARWTGPLGAGHTLVAGLEAGRSEGVSDETIFLEDRTIGTEAGGAQDEAALYLEDLFTPARNVSVAASLRYDRWENRPAAPVEGPPRSESAWSPRLALRWQPRPAWGLTAAAYRSFRAPTLNELYRGFRVGDVVTDPNPALEAERLSGAEAGAVWTPAPGGAAGRRELRLRASLFWMRLDDPVANVTLSAGPDLILRQRRNLGRTRSRGAELEARARLGPRWLLSGGYLLADAEVESYPADPSLEGLDVPQVPEHQASL